MQLNLDYNSLGHLQPKHILHCKYIFFLLVNIELIIFANITLVHQVQSIQFNLNLGEGEDGFIRFQGAFACMQQNRLKFDHDSPISKTEPLSIIYAYIHSTNLSTNIRKDYCTMKISRNLRNSDRNTSCPTVEEESNCKTAISMSRVSRQ